jgi:hypothetical protein
MKYSCDHCSYGTDKKANFVRHINRKFKCNEYVTKVSSNAYEVSSDAYEVSSDAYEVSSDASTTVSSDPKKWNCNKCAKSFSRKNILNIHRQNCTGLSILQCEICHKFFTCKQNKYRHKKNVLCRPPTLPLPSGSLSVENTDTNTNTLTVKEFTSSSNTPSTSISNVSNSQITTNSNNHTINNIINFNSFGDEGIEQLEEFLKDDSRLVERLKQIGKKKLYGVRDIQNEIFFNPKNPKGFSIIKPDKYGSGVRVRNSEGEFEYMDFEDVRDPMLNYIEKYIEIYNQTRNKCNVKFKDPKERRILHSFLKIMNDDLDIYLDDDLKDDLDITNEISNIDENTPDNQKYKQFDKVSLDNIHVQTKKFFRSKNGEFVLKAN